MTLAAASLLLKTHKEKLLLSRLIKVLPVSVISDKKYKPFSHGRGRQPYWLVPKQGSIVVVPQISLACQKCQFCGIRSTQAFLSHFPLMKSGEVIELYIIIEGVTFKLPLNSDIPIYLLASFYVFNISYPKSLTNFYNLLEYICLESKINKPSVAFSKFVASLKDN